MSGFHDNVLLGASGSQGYQISRSVRLRSSASAYLNRTPASAGNRKTWTWSGWVKRGTLPSSGYYSFLGADSGGGQSFYIAFDNSTQQLELGQGATVYRKTTQVFRDPSAWYHLVINSDTTQATASNRLKIYVNGVQVTAFATSNDPSLNGDWALNNNVATSIGADIPSTGARNYLDGYLTEVNFIDGQALTPSSFGETNTVTGVWQPKKYTGTYGTNGFYLNFSDNSAATAAAIGKDYSGNGNNWTPNNISVTAGATYDSMLDVPTQWADGGNGRGNYCVLNPLQAGNAPTDGNLKATTSGTAHRNTLGTIFFPAAKFYYEISVPAIQRVSAGMATPQLSLTSVAAGQAQFLGIYGDSTGSTIYSGATSLFTQGAIAANDVYQFCVDPTTGNAWFGRNNTWYNSAGAATGNPAGGTNPTWSSVDLTQYAPEAGVYDAGTGANANFGQRPFAYTPPSGFKALNTLNLPTPTILKGNQYFDATTYTGNASTNTIVNAGGFQPDLVWLKSRSAANNHTLFDSVRGANNILYPNLTNAAAAVSQYLNSFNSNGFTLGANENSNDSVGESSVGWQWKAGAGSSSSNTSGSITSTVSVNPTAGFSVVTYTGNGTAGATIGHGLGVAPSMMIAKNRSSGGSASYEWTVYHASLGATKAVFLNDTGAAATDAGYWYNTAPTSTLITVPSNSRTNVNGSNFVIYCFAEVPGFSKFGSYTGNGSADGPFVFCGFRPKFVLWKRTDTGGYNWNLYDTSRSPYNLMDLPLAPNISDAESVSTSNVLDGLSNGFKVRGTSVASNANGGTYIFAAFCENPFKNALAR